MIYLQLLSRRRSVSLHVDSSPSHRAGQRESRNRTFGHDAWQMGDAGFDFAVETGEDFLVVVLGVVADDLHAQYVVCGESWSYALQANEAANQQSGTDQQNKRKREFRNDEQATQTVPFEVETAIGLSAASAGLERRVRIQLDGAPCRREAEEHASCERKAKCESQHGAVDSNLIEPRNIAGIHRAYYEKARSRHEQSSGSAEKC